MIESRDSEKRDNSPQDVRTEASEGHSTWERRIAETEASYPRSSRAIYQRAMTGRSRKAAMDAFCIMCMGYQPFEVKHCTAPECPLYPYRSNVKAQR